MQTFRIRTTVLKDGQLSIRDLPFRAGVKVEVVIRKEEDRNALARELKALFKEIRSLPQANIITEEDIAAEIVAYRASKAK